MALDKLYIPNNNDSVSVYDITTVATPTLGSILTLPSSGNAQSVAIDSAGNVFIADRVAGRVYKFNSSDTMLLDVAVAQGGEGPKSLVVDANDDVWAFFGNTTDTLKLANATLATSATVTTVKGNLVGVGANTVYDAVVAYDNASGKLYRINTSSNVLVATVDVDDAFTVPGTIATALDEITQIASAGDKVYVGVSLVPGPVDPHHLVIYDLDTDAVSTGDPTDEVESVAVFCNGANVYMADKSNRVHKYTLTGGLLASFNLAAVGGRITAITADDTANRLIILDDGFFPGKVGFHVLDVTTGLVEFSGLSTGSIAGRSVAGDFTGFQRLNLIDPATPPAAAPTIDATLLYAFVRENGRIDVVGLENAVTNTTTVDVEITSPLSTIITGIVPRADKGFSGSTSPAAVGDILGFQDLTVTANGPGGSVTANVLTEPKVQRFAEQNAFEAATGASLATLVGRPVDILGVPLKDITDFSTWGGFVARRLQDIYRISRCLQNSISKFNDIEVFKIDVLSNITFLTQGDTPTLQFTVIDERTGITEDITGGVIHLDVFDGLQGNILIFRKECTITSGANGVCETTLTSTDTAATGEFFATVKVVFPGGAILTTPKYRLSITPTP